jgi:hypothetical protein
VKLIKISAVGEQYSDGHCYLELKLEIVNKKGDILKDRGSRWMVVGDIMEINSKITSIK